MNHEGFRLKKSWMAAVCTCTTSPSVGSRRVLCLLVTRTWSIIILVHVHVRSWPYCTALCTSTASELKMRDCIACTTCTRLTEHLWEARCCGLGQKEEGGGQVGGERRRACSPVSGSSLQTATSAPVPSAPTSNPPHRLPPHQYQPWRSYML